MRIVRLAVALSVAVVLVAGCKGGRDAGSTATPAPTDNGVSALPANEIVNRSLQALREAVSFRLKGATTDEDMKIDVDLMYRGEDVIGKVTVDGAGLELIKVGTLLYIKPDETALKELSRGNNAVAALLRGKWLKGLADSGDLAGFGEIADIDQVLKPSGELSKGETKDVNGTPAITLEEKSAGGDKLYVATVGPPYPLRIEGEGGDSRGVLDFSEFGAEVDVKAPPSTEVVDVDQLPS
jgi:hypothetical protein